MPGIRDYIFILTSFLIVLNSTAQNSTYQILDANNVHIGLFQKGRIAYSGDGPFYSEAPAGGGVGPLFAAMLWLSGINQDGDYLGFLTQYINEGAPTTGPAADSLFTIQQFDKYNDLFFRVWKVSAEEIEYHKQNWFKSDYTIPQSLSDWPANGSAELQTAMQLAPFADGNNNNIYEPHLGEYPVIKGDKSVFAMINDYNMPELDEPFTTQSEIEIHIMMYAYKDAPNSLIGNTIFLNYKLINRSAYNDFSELYLGQYMDFDLGFYNDDYHGCDSALNLFYVYNGDLNDGPDSISYQNQLPAFGVTSLSHPLLSFMGGFKYSIIGVPDNVIEAFDYFQAIYKDGNHLTYGGNGYGGVIPTNYYMNSRPDNPSGWNEINENNPPADRRGVGGYGPFQLNRGDTLCLELAMVFANDLNYADNVSSVKLLYNFTAQLQAIFPDAENGYCINSIQDTTIKNLFVPDIESFLLYPNPASKTVSVFTGSMEDVNLQIELYDNSAKKVFVGSYTIKQPNTEIIIPIQTLQSGIYAVVFYYDGYASTELFMVKN